MRASVHKFTVMAFVAITFAAQILVILPHHHHDDSHVPCINIAHCLSHDVGGDECAHEHCAPESSGSDCMVKIDIAEVVTEKSCRAIIDRFAAINDFFAVGVLGDDYIEQSHVLNLQQKRCASHTNIHGYISTLPKLNAVRAPSCM